MNNAKTGVLSSTQEKAESKSYGNKKLSRMFSNGWEFIMGLRSYFDFELRTTTIYAIAAIIMGFVSFSINHTAYATLVMLVVLIVLTFVLKAAFKIKEGAKWWLGNGIIVYIILWLIIWTIFYNAYVL